MVDILMRNKGPIHSDKALWRKIDLPAGLLFGDKSCDVYKILVVVIKIGEIDFGKNSN